MRTPEDFLNLIADLFLRTLYLSAASIKAQYPSVTFAWRFEPFWPDHVDILTELVECLEKKGGPERADWQAVRPVLAQFVADQAAAGAHTGGRLSAWAESTLERQSET